MTTLAISPSRTASSGSTGRRSHLGKPSRGVPLTSTTLRLFIGIACPPLPSLLGLLQDLEVAAHGSESGLRVVAAANLHVTLRFLGSTPISKVASITAAMAGLGACPAFTLKLRGAGSFPGVLWLGVSPEDALVALATRLAAALADADAETAPRASRVPLATPLAGELREYRPHLTLARLQRSAGFRSGHWVEEHRGADWGELPVAAVHLYKSEAGLTGVRYTIIHSVALQQPGNPANVQSF